METIGVTLFHLEKQRVSHVCGPALLKRVAVSLLVACALLCAGLSVPRNAVALDSAKLTARPNAGSGSDVIGGTETRLTWEVQADPDESVNGLTLTLPEGTTFETDGARLTMLSGEDLMDRTPMKPSLTAKGQTLKVDFGQDAPAGGFFRLELYGVTFPTEGGTENFSATYTLADGSSHKVPQVPSVEIKGVTFFDNLVSSLEQQDWVKAWNSNMFLRLFLNPVILVQSLPMVFKGFLMSLSIVLVAFPLAIPFGFALSLMRISKSRILRCLASIYVNIIRGTPAFLQIYIAFFGLPLAGVKVDDYVLGVIVMAMNSSAYLCEIFRAGIQSIPKGQNEAARSLGMNAFQTLLYVMIPQTFRNVLPTLTSEFILLYKDTSLLAAVGVVEIVMNARTIVATTGSITPYVVAALFYLVITLPLAHLVGKLEGRLLGTDAGKKKRPVKSAGEVVPTPADHTVGL